MYFFTATDTNTKKLNPSKAPFYSRGSLLCEVGLASLIYHDTAMSSETFIC